MPDESPFAFASVVGGPVNLLNDAAAVKEYPDSPASRSAAPERSSLKSPGSMRCTSGCWATIVMPMETKFYGMREFAIEDPDGYVITFAERVPQS